MSHFKLFPDNAGLTLVNITPGCPITGYLDHLLNTTQCTGIQVCFHWNLGPQCKI